MRVILCTERLDEGVCGRRVREIWVRISRWHRCNLFVSRSIVSVWICILVLFVAPEMFLSFLWWAELTQQNCHNRTATKEMTQQNCHSRTDSRTATAELLQHNCHSRNDTAELPQQNWHSRTDTAELTHQNWHSRTATTELPQQNWHNRTDTAELPQQNWNSRTATAELTQQNCHSRTDTAELPQQKPSAVSVALTEPQSLYRAETLTKFECWIIQSVGNNAKFS